MTHSPGPLGALKRAMIGFSLDHPRLVVAVTVLVTAIAAAQLPRVKIDTDPQNMLQADEPVRVLHNEIRETFALRDFLVVGIVNEDGVFRPDILERVAGLTEHLLDQEGVIKEDVLAPTEVDIIRGAGGTVDVSRLMEEPPADAAGAEAIHADLVANPVLRGKLGSDDGRALALYIPLEAKEYAGDVAAAVREWTAANPGEETVHIAGLPVAEDTFGLQMFQQMAVFAPAAFAVIFVLMLLFFKRLSLVLAPMIVAMMTVLWTMGALVGTGFTVHIMSSMIPVFLMPIAVLDSIHILSEVHDNRSRFRSMRETLDHVLDHLFVPITLTSVTTIVGFGALIMTPIPPVQVFGGFVALGVASAWFLSLTFNPAFAVLISARADAEGAGAGSDAGPAGAVAGGTPAAAAPALTPATGPLQSLARTAVRFRGLLLAASAAALVLAIVGIQRISVNDNPVHWFKPGHPLRVAERDLGHHLAGTYLAYLQVDGGKDGAFLDPDALKWVETLQAHIATLPNVGGVSSVTDIIKKVRQELLDGDPAAAVLPETQEAVAQMLFLYEIGGGDPEDLFKMITPEHDRVALWVQMVEGENRQVAGTLDDTAGWIAANPPPGGLRTDWAGLSVINVVWQDRMVSGMGRALAGSFGVVTLLMMLLFRSIRLGLVAMIPLTLTIAVTYGLVGWTGRDYDMPIAVLSSLSLGLSVDFAIHMLQRTRDLFRVHHGDFGVTMREFFGSPARALARNIVVIAVGFAPMFFAALVPYMTVGAFFFAIMIVSGGATLVLLPAILSFLPGRVIAGRAPTEAQP